ncbi:MAG: TPM domain-containing protein [Chitinophagaceae bacterium]|nr:TPM domain-containing protein [Chitinophagaceae bacterium]MCB9046741.1 TPM domain-containing protein [Chitinophagales bacterium]
MSLFGKNKQPLNKEEQEKVVAAIQNAEKNTTGELRVFMESRCNYVDAMDRAKEVFAELGMTETVRRNAVLIYMAYDDHQFAILGDKEIYEQAGGPVFWKNAAQVFRQYLGNGQMAEGFVACINELGNALAKYFPYDPTVTKNELPDEIVFGK